MPKLIKPKLAIELIPSSCHFSNVRTMIPKKDWDTIRFSVYKNAQHKCEICGGNGIDQGYKHRVECHEIWDYDDENKVQKLVGLISLCVVCHQVKHIGRAMAMGRKQQCFKQLARINKWTLAQINEYIRVSFEKHLERSKFQWTLDISMLNEEPYSLGLKLGQKRIFEVKRYKKKRKKKSTKKKAAKKANKRPPRR